MESFKKILMIGAVVFLGSLTAFAQRENDPKKVPPKGDDRPKVLGPRGDKNQPKDNDRPRSSDGDRDRPKKP